jgi:hypothetical protein
MATAYPKFTSASTGLTTWSDGRTSSYANPTPVSSGTINGERIDIGTDQTFVDPLKATKNIAPTIDVSTLSSNQKPLTTPTMGSTANTASSAVTSQAGAMTDIAKEQQSKIDTAQKETNNSSSALRSYLDKLAGKGQAQIEAETEAGIPKLNQELTDITNQIEAKQLAARRQIEAIQARPGSTKAQIDLEVQEINRQNAKELADLSIIQNARNRNLLTAQDLVNRKIELEYGDLKDRIEAEKFFYQENKDDLTKAEQNLLNERIRQDERQYNEGVALEKTKQELIIQASQNQNVPLSVIQQAQKAKTQDEVARILSPYMRDLTEIAYKNQQLTNARLQGEKLKQDLAKGKALTGEYGTIINGVSTLVPATSREIFQETLTENIANGDFKNAYTNVINAVSNGLTGENKTRFDSAVTDIGVMGGLRDAIEAYTEAGGNTGFLKGSAEQIARRFGQLKTDPKFAELAVQLEREFQAYRQGMTGAAFTNKESREYASVNPTSGKSLDLNLAVIDGALNQLTNRVNSAVNQRVPDAKKIYDLAYTKQTVETSNPWPTLESQTSNFYSPTGGYVLPK